MTDSYGSFSAHNVAFASSLIPYTALKVSKYGVISGPYLLVFSTGKYGPEITPYRDIFHAVRATIINVN